MLYEVITIAVPEPGNDFLVEDGVEFVGRAGHDEQGLYFGQFNSFARCRTNGVWQYDGVFEYQRLPFSGGGHFAVSLFIPAVKVVDRGLVQDNPTVEQLAKRIARDIVNRRAETSAVV